MNHSINTNKSHYEETPGGWSGGLNFGAAIPPMAVIVVSIAIVFLLKQMPKTTDTQPTTTEDQIAPLFTPEVQSWSQKIVAWGEKFDLDPNLVATVMQIESCGHSGAISSAGAMGLFQVMPYHFSENEDPYKPNINARRGLTYLKESLNAGSGDIRLTLAGYNGGITGAKRHESDWSKETTRFVYWGMGIYKDAARGNTHSDRLEEWLLAGGASLCRSAAKNLGFAP